MLRRNLSPPFAPRLAQMRTSRALRVGLVRSLSLDGPRGQPALNAPHKLAGSALWFQFLRRREDQIRIGERFASCEMRLGNITPYSWKPGSPCNRRAMARAV
jgi:hypothetical protein